MKKSHRSEIFALDNPTYCWLMWRFTQWVGVCEDDAKSQQISKIVDIREQAHRPEMAVADKPNLIPVVREDEISIGGFRRIVHPQSTIRRVRREAAIQRIRLGAFSICTTLKYNPCSIHIIKSPVTNVDNFSMVVNRIIVAVSEKLSARISIKSQ